MMGARRCGNLAMRGDLGFLDLVMRGRLGSEMRLKTRVHLLILGLCLGFPNISPAPLVYTPGEGWIYAQPDEDLGKWRRERAEEQLQVARDALEKEDYSLARRAARQVVRKWPLSDFAPEAQFIVGFCYEKTDMDEKAFAEYQKVLDNYPKAKNHDEILQRQYEICNRFYGGQWFKLWGRIPIFPSMSKTAEMYEQLIESAPYSDVAPQAQIKIGKAREKKDQYDRAVKAYERAADRYNNRKEVAAEALYNAGLAYHKQAREAEYDQNSANLAIETLSDFLALYPEDERGPEARKLIQELKVEQARGSFRIAEYYEKKRRWRGAMVYYNEVLVLAPETDYAQKARERLEEIKTKVEPEVPEPAPEKEKEAQPVEASQPS